MILELEMNDYKLMNSFRADLLSLEARSFITLPSISIQYLGFVFGIAHLIWQ